MFTPHTEPEIKEMLKVIGVESVEELFQVVPEKFRFPELSLPPKLSEMEVMQYLADLAQENETTDQLISFVGAGAYDHYVPAAVDSIISRGEFLTAYTPYQPEISQGTLQAIFEYQSLLVSLTGMDVCNASHYDGATATAEAGILAYHHFRKKRSKMLFSSSVNPEYRETVKTYLSGHEKVQIIENAKDGQDDPNTLIDMIDMDTAMVVVQYPDFFGRIFDYTEISKAAHEKGALFVVVVNPLALALFKSPSEIGADIIVGEGQPFGIPVSYGGPYLGIFTTTTQLMRKISGRLVGETVDENGNRGYVLTLTAREQHIRRDKATSNICSNQGLMALASTVYLSLLGKEGLKKVAKLNYNKAHYAAQEIAKIDGFSVCNDQPFFNEFTVCCPMSASDLNEKLLERGILGGYDLSQQYPNLDNHLLMAVTEKMGKDEIDYLCEVLKEVTNA